MVGTRGLLRSLRQSALADRRIFIRLCLVVEPPFSELRIPPHNPIKKGTARVPFFIGRDERIRTSDFLHPMQALYQTELRPENSLISNTIFLLCNKFLLKYIVCNEKAVTRTAQANLNIRFYFF